MFWSDNVTNLLVKQTSLYSMQVNGTSISTSSHEIERFISIHVLMGIMKLSVYDMYWVAEARYTMIADVISSKRYKQLHKFIHVVDNTAKENPENKNNKLFKICSILEGIRANCIKIEPEEVQLVDEQIRPVTTKSSGICQYNPQKHQKWGFKMFVRAGQSGFMYDIFSILEKQC